MENKKIQRLHKLWISFSLQNKVKYMILCAAVVVILSITADFLVSIFGMMGFDSVLKGNSQSLAFWAAMEGEKNAFAVYVREETEESHKNYQKACEETNKTIQELPYDYKKIGRDRYAKVWSIRNMYENYVKYRDCFLLLSQKDADYTKQLYTIYRVQGYLCSYAGQLEQMTVKMGNEKYESKKYVLVIVPIVSILWGVLALFMVRLLQRSVNKSIIRPVVELAEDSDRIGENDFSGTVVHVEGADEIARLVQAFSRMKASTQGYISALKEKHEMERQLDEVQLQLLKNQINPHFLFNTLNMIASMAQIEEADVTEKMITALSRLFRYNLKSTDSVMPLERELKVVQDYMYLQQMRFGQRLRFTAQCSPDTKEILIPAFSLQPLVENAVLHGLSSKSKGGKIHIRAWFKGKRLWISVADTGEGVEYHRLGDIRSSLRREDNKKTGIGISNIYRRVHGMYSDGELFIYSKKRCGFVVQMAFTPEESS